jgi:hypothetical protein
VDDVDARVVVGEDVDAQHLSGWIIDLHRTRHESSLFGWLVADGWCWFVLREEYCWLVAGG